jgi:hypothetical protein
MAQAVEHLPREFKPKYKKINQEPDVVVYSYNPNT